MMKTLFSLLISVITGATAFAQTAAMTKQETSPQPIAAPKAIKIIPHRAYYSVKLKSAKGDSAVRNTEGRMIIEMTHDCEGWMLKQESASVVDLKEAPTEMMRSVYTAWESSDGKNLRFKTERVFNEQAKDSVEGTAEFNDKGGVIKYQTPEMKQVRMEQGTLPPIAHLHRLIEVAESGNRTSSVQVFDGSFYGNPVLIDAFIGDKKGNCKITDTKDTVYPMNLAIYAMPSVAPNPNFEIKQNMAENGVMCSYEINFGDYVVEGTLDRFEPLPDKSCQKK